MTKTPGRPPSARQRRRMGYAPAKESERFMFKLRSAKRRGRCLRCDRPGELVCARCS